MPDDDSDAGFFRSLSGLATDWVNAKRRSLATEPQTNVDSMGGRSSYTFSGQELDFDDLRDIKSVREDGGQVAQLMNSKALLNFGEGAEFTVENDEETETVVDGEPMTLSEYLNDAMFPHLDLLVLDLGSDALWFPYAAGETLETRKGDFKEALPAEPWTLLPETDARGEIIRWHQRVQNANGGYTETTLPPDDLWHIVLNKSSARDKTGISEVLRSKDEIQAFKENEAAINQAIELHGFPQRHVKVGKEDGAPVRDDDLRRVRSIFDPRTTDANTAYFTGQDVDVETLEAHQFDYTAIHEMDMRNLTTALGLPLEAGNVGSDGLGSGKPAELRFAMLKLSIKANQRQFGVQFVEKVVRPALEQYTPFDADATIELRIDDPLEDIGETADLINSIGEYMTNAEARRRLDLPEPEDDEVAESYRTPAEIEKDEAGVQDDPMGGLFSERAEQAVDEELSGRGLTASTARTLQEDFEAELFELVATEEQEDFETGARLGVGVNFPNSGVYVDWNIAAWPEEERLDGPHVSEYATVEDARTVAQGEVRELSAHSLQEDVEDIATDDYPEAAVENARMALEAREETGDPNDCGTRVGWERANQLDNGESLSEDTISRMAQFERHEDNYDPEAPREDCGWMMWKAWGGREGIEWAQDKMDAFEEARQASEGDTDFRCLADGITDAQLDAAPAWDRPLLEMYQSVSDPDAPTDRALVSYAESATPEFVLERIREAIRSGAMFSSFEEIPSDRLMDLRQEFADSLTEPEGFTLDSITESLMDFEADLSRDDAERIARTESSAVLNKAREEGYEAKGDADEGLFYWTGADPGDDRQTEACEWLIRETNPFHGGEPVPMKELRQLVDEAPTHDDEMDNDLARPDSWIVHPNERSSFVKAPDNWRSLS
jgi:hypothetical protein